MHVRSLSVSDLATESDCDAVWSHTRPREEDADANTQKIVRENKIGMIPIH